jgi:hypothetical protein
MTRSRARQSFRVIASLIAVAATVALAAVAAPGFSTAASGPTAGRSSASPAAHHHDGAPMGKPSPAEFRLMMERLFGQHAVLAAWLMRAPAEEAAGGAESTGFTDAARAELQRNTRELTQAVAAMHGKAAGAKFATLWRARTKALEGYGVARASADQVGATVAEQELARTANRYGVLVVGLGGDGTAAMTDLQTRTKPLLAATDAYAAGQYPQAFSQARDAYAQMYRQGLAFAAETTANGSTAGIASQATDLRSALGELFGEHAALAFDASRTVVAQSPAGPAAADALNANTADVVEAVRAALGPQTATAVSQVWAAHIDALMQFAVAVASGDDAAQSRARGALDQFPARLGTVLAGVAGDAAPTLVTSLQQHDEQLLQQVTAFAAEDYPRSAALAYHGYDHMFGVARMLAGALEARSMAAAPRRGAHTGDGGMSR